MPSPPLAGVARSPLFRSLRHNPEDGTAREHGMDLFATLDPDGSAIFYFRHWSRDRNATNICQITSREEAILFIRDQFTKPGLFSGWNHKGLSEFLPEVCVKKDREWG